MKYHGNRWMLDFNQNDKNSEEKNKQFYSN